MRIGVIGAGHIGATVAQRLVAEGHEVAISNSRGREAVEPIAAEIGATAATVAEAAEFGEIVFEAIPLKEYETLPAEPLKGKIVVDAANYYPGRDGTFDEIENGTASTELIQRHLPDSKVVKAFNTIQWTNIRDRHKPRGENDRLAVPVAADDEDAKRTVFGLVDQVGFDPVDGGTLHESKRQEPDTPVYGLVTDAQGAREAIASAA
jgi:predicted dinucleotide-binding enzyme